MNDSAYKISLDIHEHISQAVLKAKRTDTGRKIYISLRSGGTPYIIAENCYAVFTAVKPDGSILYNACTIEGNEIVYEFTDQTCAAIGRSRCEIKLYGFDDALITSPRFALLVEGTLYPDGKVESSDEFSALTQMVSDGLEAIKNANLATEAATQAAASANTATEAADGATADAIQATEDASVAANTANQASGTANQAAAAAINASVSANNAAQTATKAATDATTAANNANAAAVEVNNAVSNANLAAENANKAAHTAKALMVVGNASGNNISLDKAINQFLVGLRICGKTTQNGTPTPATPVDFVSVGCSGSITVNIDGKSDAQSMTIATPNGLPGIPVSSGGTYIDSSGQQWICDEKDYANGVYVQRIGLKTLTGTEGYFDYISGYGVVSVTLPHADRTSVLCSHALEGNGVSWASANSIAFKVSLFGGATMAEFVSYVAAQYKNGTPIKIAYVMPTPIETPLSEEELAAYAALHTYRGNTTVTNDASAHMELEYVMDAKKYIDSQISAGILAATVE